MLVDSHCHLDFADFAGELDRVMDRAAAAGVGMMVTICTGLNKFAQVRAVAAQFPNVYCTAGVHPHDAAGEGQQTPDALIALAADALVVGIGETGLDYHYERSPRSDQQASFRAHIAAARETGLPLIVHSREADDDMMEILAGEMAQGAFPGVLHCFSSGAQLAEKAIDLGLYVSFSGILTFKKAEALCEIAAGLPLDRLLVETDAPYLAPAPNRGKRNEPSFVAHTAAKLAEIKGLTPGELAAATTDNFFRLFAKADRAKLTNEAP